MLYKKWHPIRVYVLPLSNLEPLPLYIMCTSLPMGTQMGKVHLLITKRGVLCRDKLCPSGAFLSKRNLSEFKEKYSVCVCLITDDSLENNTSVREKAQSQTDSLLPAKGGREEVRQGGILCHSTEMKLHG